MLEVAKISGLESPADLGTKYHAGEHLRRLKKKVCIGDPADVESMGPLGDDPRRFTLPNRERWQLS